MIFVISEGRALDSSHVQLKTDPGHAEKAVSPLSQIKLLLTLETNQLLFYFIFFFTLLLYSKMHWLDMSSIARRYIH